MKKMKLITSLLLSLVLVMSAISNIVFAETGLHHGNTELIVNGTDVTVVNDYGSKGKAASDTVYRVSGKRSSSAFVNGTGNLEISSAIFETAFMLPSNEVAIGSYLSYYEANATGSSNRQEGPFIKITATDGIASHVKSSTGAAYWTLTSEADYDIELNKWYTLAIEFPAGGAKNGNIYLNGKLVHEFGKNVEIYGVYALKLGAMSTDNFYLDNLHGYKNGTDATFDINKLTPSDVVAAGDVTVENNVVTVPFGTTVGGLDDILTTTDGQSDVIRVYTDESMTTEAQSGDPADGKTLVVAAVNGTDGIERAYSYYTIAQAAKPDPYADILKGETLTEDFGINGDAVMEFERGVYGKASDDMAYKFTKTDSDSYINYKCIHKDSAYSLVEFSFAKESTDNGFQLEMNYYEDKLQSIRKSTSIYFRDEGLGWGSSTDKLYDRPYEAGKWYTVAVQFPTNGEKDVIIYVNGNLAHTGEIKAGAWGLAYARFNISQNKTLYLDNVRKAKEEYNPGNDAKAALTITNGVIKDNVIKVIDKDKFDVNYSSTAANLRMYANDGTQVYSLADADYVVAAGKMTRDGVELERTYTYLTIEEAPVIVYYTKDGETLTANLLAGGEATLILAYYQDKGLTGHTPVAATDDNADGIYSAEVTEAMTDGLSYRIFAWDSIDGLYPLIAATDVE